MKYIMLKQLQNLGGGKNMTKFEKHVKNFICVRTQKKRARENIGFPLDSMSPALGAVLGGFIQ